MRAGYVTECLTNKRTLAFTVDFVDTFACQGETLGILKVDGESSGVYGHGCAKNVEDDVVGKFGQLHNPAFWFVVVQVGTKESSSRNFVEFDLNLSSQLFLNEVNKNYGHCREVKMHLD